MKKEKIIIGINLIILIISVSLVCINNNINNTMLDNANDKMIEHYAGCNDGILMSYYLNNKLYNTTFNDKDLELLYHLCGGKWDGNNPTKFYEIIDAYIGDKKLQIIVNDDLSNIDNFEVDIAQHKTKDISCVVRTLYWDGVDYQEVYEYSEVCYEVNK